jgi:hypothetical protein
MWILWAALAAEARQTAFDAQPGKNATTYTFGWTDASGPHRAAFSLPSAKVANDLDYPRRPQLDDLLQTEAAAVRAWAAEHLKGVDLKVKVAGNQLSYAVSGRSRDRIKTVLANAQAVAAKSGDQWLAENEATRMDGGAISVDHARLAAEYATVLLPVASAVGTLPDPRDQANLLLGFIQDIPYEARVNGGDKGYRRPLALIDRNRGDCDSKSTLFLALMAASHPEVGTAIVYVPNHALVALRLPVEKGDATVKIDDEKWVLAEPVGPAEVSVGEVGKEHVKQAKKGEIRRVELD